MRKLWLYITAMFTALITDQTGQFNLAALLPKLGGGIMPRNTVPSRGGFRTDVQVTDGDPLYATSALCFAIYNAQVAGVWFTLWEMTVPAQQALHWGYGSPATPQNQGYLWFAVAPAAAPFSVGTLRLVQQNARRTRTVVVAELADVSLHGVTVATEVLLDKNEMIALPEKVEHPCVGEDSFIGLQYNAQAIVVATHCLFKIPITVYQ